jgi:hypothetical protein
MAPKLVKKTHNSKIAGHMGIFKILEQIWKHYWWPNMDAKIKQHIHHCLVYQTSINKGTLLMAPQVSLLEVLHPNQRVHGDLYNPVGQNDQDHYPMHMGGLDLHVWHANTDLHRPMAGVLQHHPESAV